MLRACFFPLPSPYNSKAGPCGNRLRFLTPATWAASLLLVFDFGELGVDDVVLRRGTRASVAGRARTRTGGGRSGGKRLRGLLKRGDLRLDRILVVALHHLFQIR